MRVGLLLGLGLAAGLAGPVAAQSSVVDQPRVPPDDSWTYEITNEAGGRWSQITQQITVSRTEPDAIAIDISRAGSPMPPMSALFGADWSRVRSVNGLSTTVNRPLDFPLRVGKAWTVGYTEQNPNRQHSSETFRTPYRVTGWEQVTVPAGTFRAIKIEADGEWTAVTAPSVSAVSGGRVDAGGSASVAQTVRTMPTTATGRTYKAFWYVPSVKRWVKSEEDYYSSGGVQSSSEKSELMSFKVTGLKAAG